MTCDEHDELESTVAAYVLDACEDDKEGEVAKAHIEACAGCRELARRLARAAAAVPLAADEVKPPDRLRARILSAAAAAPPAPEGPISARNVVRLPRVAAAMPTRRVGRRWYLPAAVAAVALLAASVVGLGAWDASLSRQVAEQSRLLGQANQQNQQLQQQNRQLVQQVSQAPNIYTLSGSGPLAGASGQVKALKTDPVLIFQFSGLPQPPPGKVYEIWLIPPPGAGAPIRGGVFSPDRSGSATVSIARTLDGIKIVAVTVENGPNGVDAPSQTPPLAGQVA
jgi:hypothetical protein